MSLCVFDRIKHIETVTGVTVSRLGGLRPWAAHGTDFPAPEPPWQGQFCKNSVFRVGGRASGLVIERTGCPRTRALYDMEVDHGRLDAGMPHQVLDGPNVGAALE